MRLPVWSLELRGLESYIISRSKIQSQASFLYKAVHVTSAGPYTGVQENVQAALQQESEDVMLLKRHGCLILGVSIVQ